MVAILLLVIILIITNNNIWTRELDYIRVKGRSEPIAIYELIGLRSDPISSQTTQLIEYYHQGREYYLKRQFDKAKAKFEKVVTINSSDRTTILHLQRCRHWLQNPPNDITWDDDVWTFKNK